MHDNWQPGDVVVGTLSRKPRERLEARIRTILGGPKPVRSVVLRLERQGRDDAWRHKAEGSLCGLTIPLDRLGDVLALLERAEDVAEAERDVITRNSLSLLEAATA